MELWIWLSLLGGALQAFRVAGQRLLAAGRTGARVPPSDAASPFARVVLGVPIAFCALAWSFHADGQANWRALVHGSHTGAFWFWVFAVASFQLGATVLQTRLVARRNFALGVMYVKVLIPAMAVMGVLFFGDRFGWLEWSAIVMGTLGLVLMTYGRVAGKRDLSWDWTTVGLGLGAGLVLAFTGLFAREAADALPPSLGLSDVSRGIAALACMASVQLVASAAYITLRNPREFLDLAAAWRTVAYTSVFSVGASLCWFVSFTLAHPALVNLVGQSEFFFALAISVLFFRDRPTRGELIGMSIMAAAIVIVLLV